jgi:hypothetical protein
MKSNVQRGRALDIRTYEVAPVETVAAELKPTVLTLLSDARSTLGAVLEECGRLAPGCDEPSLGADLGTSYLPFERAIDAALATRAGSLRTVEELAFMAQLELRQRFERLERVLPAHGHVTMLDECDSSLRRTRKAFRAVDAAIAKAESVAPLLDYTSELQQSLVVRRVYAKFRERALDGGEPTAERLKARFRAVGTLVAKLVGEDIYPELRVRDRLLLRDIQQRVLGWLREGEASKSSPGMRLWQDVAACIEMLSLVNRRQELVEHDAQQVHRACSALSGASDGAALEPAVWSGLSALMGIDAELDGLLSAAIRPTVGSLRPTLERLLCQLGPKKTGESASW